MKTFIDLEVLKIDKARGFQDKEPEHKSELVYLEKVQTEYGEEIKFKRIKSMLPMEEHKLGLGRFEVRVVPYLNSRTNRPELSLKIIKPAK